MSNSEQKFRLRRAGDQVLYHPGDGQEPIPVRLSWARPLTDRGGQVVILRADKKKEVATLTEIEQLDVTSREVIEEELQRRYFMPKITKVVSTAATFGNRYWHVETDRGTRRFLMKCPETDAMWITDDRCVLKDVLGNCYEIASISDLDSVSRTNADKVL